MEQHIIFLNYLKKFCRLNWCVLDVQKNVVDKFTGEESLEYEDLCRTVAYNSEKADIPYVKAVGENIYMWFFCFWDFCYVFGPICTNCVTPIQIHELSHRQRISREIITLSSYSLDELFELAEFTYFGITGINISLKDVWGKNETLSDGLVSEQTEYNLYRFKKEKERNPYEEELEWFQGIAAGKRDIDIYKKYNVAGIGVLAKNSDFKQLEYMSVCAITLATRAAIQGGVPPVVAFETSDLLLQRLSKYENMNHLLNETTDCTNIFVELVNEYKGKKSGNSIAELCKDYISQHLYKEFSIMQMAEELKMSRTYMSKKFSQQTGMTIQNYIIKERLNAAANLLKYSEESVSDISEYMHFSSPSRFSMYFKKEYGVAPLRYREENKLIEFKE